MVTCKAKGCRKRKGVQDDGFCGSCSQKQKITSTTGMDCCGKCSKNVQNDDRAMCCEKCEVWYHIECINIARALYDLINGNEVAVDDGIRWFCPSCRASTDDISQEPSSLKETIQQEIKDILPVIVKNVLTESKQCPENLSKTFADIVKKQQNHILKETIQTTSDTALKETMKSLETNLAEKKKRGRNIIITGVVEKKNEKPFQEVLEIVQSLEPKMKMNDILHVKRIGSSKKDESVKEGSSVKVIKPRLLLVSLKYESDAAFLHNNGYGRKVTCVNDDSMHAWINPDLTRAERDAQYELRVQRRKKMKDHSSTQSIDANGILNRESEIPSSSASKK